MPRAPACLGFAVRTAIYHFESLCSLYRTRRENEQMQLNVGVTYEYICDLAESERRPNFGANAARSSALAIFVYSEFARGQHRLGILAAGIFVARMLTVTLQSVNAIFLAMIKIFSAYCNENQVAKRYSDSN